jgi:hypothetical protein
MRNTNEFMKLPDSTPVAMLAGESYALRKVTEWAKANDYRFLYASGAGLDGGSRYASGAGLDGGSRYASGAGLDGGSRYASGAGLDGGSRYASASRYASGLDDRSRSPSVETGVCIALCGGFELSVQTHPSVAAWAFAETALAYRGRLLYALDYESDVLRWGEPEDLFAHVEAMTAKLRMGFHVPGPTGWRGSCREAAAIT